MMCQQFSHLFRYRSHLSEKNDCFKLLMSKYWCIKVEMAIIKLNFQSLLDEPNPNSPANSVAAQLYQVTAPTNIWSLEPKHAFSGKQTGVWKTGGFNCGAELVHYYYYYYWLNDSESLWRLVFSEESEGKEMEGESAANWERNCC